MTEPEFVLYLGSRGGSAVALALFSAISAALGLGVANQWRRLGGHNGAARVAGGAAFVLLSTGIYASSLGGFYEVRGYPGYLETRSLLPIGSSRIAWSDLERVDVRFAFRNRWRLSLVERSGNRIVSATWRRDGVEAAARAIRERLSAHAILDSQPSHVTH